MKIDLMKKYMHDEPYIDPDFMWKMPESFSIDPYDYLNQDLEEKNKPQN